MAKAPLAYKLLRRGQKPPVADKSKDALSATTRFLCAEITDGYDQRLAVADSRTGYLANFFVQTFTIFAAAAGFATKKGTGPLDVANSSRFSIAGKVLSPFSLQSRRGHQIGVRTQIFRRNEYRGVPFELDGQRLAWLRRGRR